MPDIQIPNIVIVGLQVMLAFGGAFFLAIWVSLIIWTFRDVRSRSRDLFAILLATLMVVIFGPLGVLLYFLLRPPDTLAEVYGRSLEEEALLQDLEERSVCPGCRRKIDVDWLVCPDCHTILKKRCLDCGKLLHLRWNICPYCVAPAEDMADVQEEELVAMPQGVEAPIPPAAAEVAALEIVEAPAQPESLEASIFPESVEASAFPERFEATALPERFAEVGAAEGMYAPEESEIADETAVPEHLDQPIGAESVETSESPESSNTLVLPPNPEIELPPSEEPEEEPQDQLSTPESW